MKRFTKRKIITLSLIAVVLSIGLGASVYAATQWLNAPEIKTYTQRTSPVEQKIEAPRDITAEEVIAGVNAERVKAGLGALAVNRLLNQSACLKADDMIAKGYWAHDAPDGAQPWYWIDQAGYRYINAAENLSYGFATAEGVTAGWMGSPGHRDNLLSTKYSEMGMCVRYADFQNQKRAALVVNHFGSQ